MSERGQAKASSSAPAAQKNVTSQNYLDKKDPLYKPLTNQEKLINETFKLGFDADTLAARASLAKFAFDVHKEVFREPTKLFEAQLEDVTPVNAARYINMLVERCKQVSEFATTASPACTFDLIQTSLKEMERLLVFQDATFNQNFVLVLKIVAEAQARNDMTAIADIFYGEIQSLLKNLASRILNGGSVRR